MTNPPASPRAVHSAALLQAVAEALEVMAVQAEELGAVLCSDFALVERHVASLQSLDKIAQHLDQIALVIASDDPRQAVDDISLCELKEHLQKAA